MPSDPNPLGPRILANVARLAAERDLTLEEVAERAGVGSAFLKPGGPRLPPRRVKVIAKVLRVDPQTLLDDPPDPDPSAAGRSSG
jgi:hypothetical protein